jgi:hypothetical protein
MRSQHHSADPPAGAEAEVDFGDVKVRLAGELVTCYLFAMRLCYSGKAVHRVFTSWGQAAFLEGHVHALSVLGGVPRGKVPLRQSQGRGRPGAGLAGPRGERAMDRVPLALRHRGRVLPARD